MVPGAALSKEYREENLELVEAGMANLRAHINNVTKHGVAAVVAIIRFHTDTDAEVALVQKLAREAGAFDAVPADHFAQGGAGATELGRAVMRACAAAAPAQNFRHLYDAKADGIKSKIEAIVREVYGGGGVEYRDAALKRIALYEADAALRGLPICMSKTQYAWDASRKQPSHASSLPRSTSPLYRYSLSDDPTKLGAPKDFVVTVRDLYVSAGAGFPVSYTHLTLPTTPYV